MSGRLGTGPVFAYEMITSARRWQVYAARAGFVLVLLVALVLVWFGFVSSTGRNSQVLTKKQLADLGTAFFYGLTGIQISLIMLAAPAVAAGSICIDRARGTLLHMMVTDLSDSEIVLGKLGSRLLPVFALVACGIPVAALGGLLGGIDFEALVGSFVISISLAILGCSLALAVSVWAKKVHEVLMAVYLLEGLWLLALPFWYGLTRGTTLVTPPWFEKANPFALVFAPYNNPGLASVIDFAVFFGVSVGVSALLTVVSIVGLRRAVLRSDGRKPKARRRSIFSRILPSLTGPTLDGNPVLWREWHRNRPGRLSRWLWGGLIAVTWSLTAYGAYQAITVGLGRSGGPFEIGFSLLVGFGFLMLSATSPTALSEERVQGSLDVLLATPLTTRSIVLAKWWGTYRLVLVLVILPAFSVIFLALATPDVNLAGLGMRTAQPHLIPLTITDRICSVLCCLGDFLASGAVIVSFGLLVATWVSRLGRAIAVSVISFFLMGIGWIVVSEVVAGYFRSGMTADSWHWRNRWFWESMIALSPIVGPIDAISTLSSWKTESLSFRWAGLGGVILIKGVFAAFLLWLTVATFDRCLGRVSEKPQLLRRMPQAKTIAADDL